MIVPEAESSPVGLAGCGATLDTPAMGCVQASSDEGKAVNVPQFSSTGAGCVAVVETAGGPPEPKKPPATLREFERALRELGFTKRDAESIARNGWAKGTTPASEPQPEPEPTAVQLNDLRALLIRNAAIFKGSP